MTQRPMRWGPLSPPTRRAVFGLALGMALAGVAHAQTPPPSATPEYQDRVIEGLAPSIDEDTATADAAQNPEGWARNLRFETRLGHDSFQVPGQRNTGGVALYGLLETPSHGVLSVDAQLARDPSGGLVTLRQRGLPVSGGWAVNNELGVIGTPAPTLTRQPSRVYVPGQLIEGGSTEWLNPAGGLQVQAATGQPGRLDGTVIGRLQRLPGQLTSVGAQLDVAPWSFATRAAQARGIALTDNPTLSGGTFDAQSAMLAVRRDSGNTSLQANAVNSRTSTPDATRSGFWLDADQRDGARHHSVGLFWLEPDLNWAGQPMASDLAGGYLRSAWNSREWSLDGNLDLLRSVSRPSNTGVYTSGSARWRFSRRMSFGAGAAWRSFNGEAYNTYGEVRWFHGWGSSTVRLDLARELAQSRSQRLTLDHEWPVDTGWSVATSVSGGKVVTNGLDQTVWGAAASVNAPVSSAVSLSGNLTLERATPGEARTGVNAGLNWRLTPRWSLEGRYTLTRGAAPSARRSTRWRRPCLSPRPSPTSTRCSCCCAGKTAPAPAARRLAGGRRTAAAGSRGWCSSTPTATAPRRRTSLAPRAPRCCWTACTRPKPIPRAASSSRWWQQVSEHSLFSARRCRCPGSRRGTVAPDLRCDFVTPCGWPYPSPGRAQTDISGPDRAQVRPESCRTRGMFCRISRLLACLALDSRAQAALAALLALALPMAPAAAESALSDVAPSVGAALNFRVIIPPVVRVAENDHPVVLLAAAQGEPTREATQRLVFTTNLRRGVCMDLQMADAAVARWNVQTDASAGATLSPAFGGYRLCVARPGEHAVTLHHVFTMHHDTAVRAPRAAAADAPAHPWPVHLQLAAL